MCHETRGRHGECGGPFHFARRFCTKEEQIACLEEYLESLQAEARAVEERITKMNKGR